MWIFTKNKKAFNYNLVFFLLIPFFFSPSGKSQTSINDLEYLQYLISNQKYQDCLSIIQDLKRQHIHPSIADSLYFLEGLCYFYLENLELSTKALQNIHIHSSLYPTAQLMGIFNSIYLNDSLSVLNKFKVLDDFFFKYSIKGIIPFVFIRKTNFLFIIWWN